MTIGAAPAIPYPRVRINDHHGLMSGERLLAGLLVAIGIGVSFALTVLLFGFVVLAGALLLVIGLAFLALPGRRQAAAKALGAAGLTLSGPLIYVGLAVLQSSL